MKNKSQKIFNEAVERMNELAFAGKKALDRDEDGVPNWADKDDSDSKTGAKKSKKSKKASKTTAKNEAVATLRPFIAEVMQEVYDTYETMPQSSIVREFIDMEYGKPRRTTSYYSGPSAEDMRLYGYGDMSDYDDYFYDDYGDDGDDLEEGS